MTIPTLGRLHLKRKAEPKSENLRTWVGLNDPVAVVVGVRRGLNGFNSWEPAGKIGVEENPAGRSR
jgi:hypothetical protein